MIQSFIVYGFFAFLLWKLGKIAAKREEIYLANGRDKVPFWTWEIVLSLLIFAIISGIRWQVGVDHLQYLDWYENLLAGKEFRARDIEVGFDLISKFFAYFNIHYTFYFAFIAFLQIMFIYYALKNERYLLPFVGLILIIGPHYLILMNGMRQTIAGCIFIYSIKFIQNRKLLPYLFCILFATSIHKSAIVLIVIFFIPQLNYFKHRYINIIIIFIAIYIGLNPYWLEMMKYLESILLLIGYEHYVELLDVMIARAGESNYGVRRISSLLLYLLIIWYKPYLEKEYGKKFVIYFNLSLVGLITYYLFVNAGHGFLRPTIYFRLFLIPVTGYLLHYLKSKKDYLVSYQFLLVIALSVIYLGAYLYTDYMGDIESDYSNFKFYFNYDR